MNMMYGLYLLGIFLARVLPLKAGYAVAEFVATAYARVSKKDKDNVRSNLKVILGEDTDTEEIDAYVVGVFRNFAKYLVDFFRFPRFTEEYIKEHIEIEGREHLDECLAEGKGVIIVSMHLGNWELGGAVVGGLKYPINAIVLVQENKKINDFFTKQRSINGMKGIPLGLQIKECFKVLKNNEVLAIAGDKDYTSNGIYVDFFGRKAVMPKGAAVLSIRTGAPIVFTVLTREKGDSFRLTCEEPIRYKPAGDREKDVKELMGKYLRYFEKYVREYPDQWYEFRKIWAQ